MENGAIEQGQLSEDGSQGQFVDEDPNGDATESGALEQDPVSEDGGFDPNSPESRHWQSVADKRVASLEAKLRGIEGKLAGNRLREPQQKNEGPSLDDILRPGDFQMPALPAGDLEQYGFDDKMASMLDQRVMKLMQAWTGHAVGNINNFNAQAQQQQMQQTAAQKIGAFVDENPQHGEKLLGLYDAMPQMASSDPEGFLEFARFKLGLTAAPQPTPGRGLARVVQASQTRPTRSSGAQARVPQSNSLREDVERAVADSLRRQGRG
jgi:hypothetical protein